MLTPADLDIDLLRAFVAVADEGGFTAAADRLGRTQAAMSLKIKRLEATLGKRVLERSSRHLALTPDGEVLLGYARRLLALNDETLQRLGAPAISGELKVGVAEYFLPTHLPQALAQFGRSHPGVHVQARVGFAQDLTTAFERGELDLVLTRRERGGGPGRLIWRDPMVWVAAEGFDIAAERPLRLCLLPHPCVYRTHGIAALDRIGRRWEAAYTAPSVLGVQAAALAGVGVAVLSRTAMVDGLRELDPSEGFPMLPELEVVVLGENGHAAALAQPLLRLILDSARLALPQAA
jgi:DNA-binding transcriptional LysR family regulator